MDSTLGYNLRVTTMISGRRFIGISTIFLGPDDDNFLEDKKRLSLSTLFSFSWGLKENMERTYVD